MKQIIQSLKNGLVEIAEVPAPRVSGGRVLIDTHRTLVSAGTERMLVEFGRANWLDKARQQPDKVKMVLEKARTDGVVATLDAVRSKLDQPIPLGYCNVGTVRGVGNGVQGFAVGDRVVSNGNHAEVVNVPRNLCARVPDGVSDDQAAFTVLCAIGLQGIRLVNPTLGECVVVTGLGLIGLLTVQMLRAQGCRVMGIDFDPARLELARKFGAETVNPGAGEDVLAAAQRFSRGRGVDAVIITASTDSNEPVSQAAKMSRKRGRIVLVGVTGLELSRADFFEKELSFQVSCSYGPGRYDPEYEAGGQDYPFAYVRWTEQRNFEAVLDLMAAGAIDVAPLVSHRYALADAEQAYNLLSSGEPSMGILLDYAAADAATTGAGIAASDAAGRDHAAPSDSTVGHTGSVAFLGAGNYAGRVLIPAFKAAGARLHSVISAGGLTAALAQRKFEFTAAGTGIDDVLGNRDIDTVVIATRHDQHARQVLQALEAGKHVFCEKPLCLTLDELDEIEAVMETRPDQQLMIGFNRRFAPQVVTMKALLANVAEPKAMIMTVNAGDIPADHWTQDPAVGGGRIIGEGCHFIDLLRHLAGAPITRFHAVALGAGPGEIADDKAMITLEFADGSVGTVHYLANGSKAFPKERLEVFCAGRVLQLDNFRKLQGWGWKGFSGNTLWQQDKGQKACAAAFLAAVRKQAPSAIPTDEVLEVSRVTIEIGEALR
jgi:predicted dehydrogenase/threonine dehydrogenase-like Zn-dependent dehydrogenase